MIFDGGNASPCTRYVTWNMREETTKDVKNVREEVTRIVVVHIAQTNERRRAAEQTITKPRETQNDEQFKHLA